MSFRASPDDIRDLLALVRLDHPEVQTVAREVHDATGFDGGGWNSGHCRELLALADAIARNLVDDHQRTADWLETKAQQADVFDNPDFALSWQELRALIGPIAPEVPALQLGFDEQAAPFVLKALPWKQTADQYAGYAVPSFGLQPDRLAGLLKQDWPQLSLPGFLTVGSRTMSPAGPLALGGPATPSSVRLPFTGLEPEAGDGIVADPIPPREPDILADPIPERGPTILKDPIPPRGPTILSDPIPELGPTILKDPIPPREPSIRKSSTGEEDGDETGYPTIKPGAADGETAGRFFPKSIKDSAREEDPTSTCVYCGRPEAGSQIDHAIPRSRGGDATLDNAQLTCDWCNRSKGNSDYPKNPPPDYVGQWPPPWW